jgi:hypothetical protein
VTRTAFTLSFLSAIAVSAGPSASDVSRLVTQIALDPDACYRVTDLNFSKDDLRVYLTSGYLSFAKPINGARVAAVFTTDIEAGDAELLLIPPYRSERLSLASFTESPNLDEHFKATVMIFTDSTAAELESALASQGGRKNAEMGAMLAESYTASLRNLVGSFQVRLVHDLLSSDPKSGMFYMGVAGRKLGNFDVMYDPMSVEEITVGQVAWRDTRSYFDTWMSFPGKKQRKDPASQHAPPFALDNYRIDATIQPDLSVTATTRVTLTPKALAGRALPFWISRQMRVTGAKIDGAPAEVFQRESLRDTLMHGNENEEFLLVAPVDLEPSKPHEIEVHHEGAVIGKAGQHVFYVTARGIWYPRLGSGFAHFDLTFRYPKNLVLVTTGDTVSERTEGDMRVSEFRAPSPLRFAGFNLGEYDCMSRDRDGYKINVCANREIEAALKQGGFAPAVIAHPEGMRRGRGQTSLDSLPPQAPPNPTARLELLADDVAGALQYMSAQFGPPPVRRLSVSPIPATMGQGFPGLIYLSTLSYMDPTQRPPGVRNPYSQLFFSDVLDAHEVAHQWWGNLVSSEGYGDDWIMESLADYSALMFLEKKKGPRALETVLDRYRNHLLEKTDAGRTIESSGPITWGVRLISSHSPDSWRAITYEKGAWIMHMLRRRLGDERFASMLRDMCERYRFHTLSTEQFREHLQRFGLPKSPDPDFRIFFDNWVYGTGIPTVKLTHSVRAGKMTGTLTASGAGDDFTGFVPVELQQGRQKTVHWLHVSSDGSPFSIPLRQAAGNARIAVLSTDCLIAK